MNTSGDVTIRYQHEKDAARFFQILRNPNFKYFPVNLSTVEEEMVWLHANRKKRRNNQEWNYAILYRGKLVGGIGIRVDQFRKYMGEIGYFIDEPYWNKNIASTAVAMVERIGFGKLGLKRIEIRMMPQNTGSEKVAVKNGYVKEGLLKRSHLDKDGLMKDVYLYAKVS
jgi:[ribosomal protein S5]-alanine N-acetyltransferase